MANDVADDDGLRIVLTPVQLAAVLQRASIRQNEEIRNRIGGATVLLGGALELAGSAVLLLAPDPTLATKVGGWIFAVHGSDTAATGLRQIWTGQPQTTLTAGAVGAMAQTFGASPRQASMIGSIADTIVPLLVATGIGAARVLAVRVGTIDLAAEEAAGGHTIARHVAKTEAELASRLADQPKIAAASSFRSLEEAETFISRAIQQNLAGVRTWARSAPIGGRYVILQDMDSTVGYSLARGSQSLRDVTRLRVVLEKIAIKGKLYFVLTSYPQP
jgi:hypothetical protein